MAIKTNRSLDKRRDNRTKEKFASDIKSWTEKEKKWSKIIEADLKSRGFAVEVKDNGADNTGELIEKPTRKLSNLDYIFVINHRPILADIKTNDRGVDFGDVPCLTIKVSSIREAISVDGRLIVVDRDYFIIFRRDVLKIMIKNIKPKIYEAFSPNDYCLRINKADYPKYISDKRIENMAEVRRWTKEAQQIIKEKENELFRKR